MSRNTRFTKTINENIVLIINIVKTINENANIVVHKLSL